MVLRDVLATTPHALCQVYGRAGLPVSRAVLGAVGFGGTWLAAGAGVGAERAGCGGATRGAAGGG
jgi:hypothetical protein